MLSKRLAKQRSSRKQLEKKANSLLNTIRQKGRQKGSRVVADEALSPKKGTGTISDSCDYTSADDTDREPQIDQKEFVRVNEKRKRKKKLLRKKYREFYRGQDKPTKSKQALVDELVEEAEAALDSNENRGNLGVALRLTDGRILVTAECWKRTEVCAEQIALIRSISENPENEIEAMAIYSDAGDAYPVPCGKCRQLLADFGNFPVYLVDGNHRRLVTSTFQLYPHTFRNPEKSTKIDYISKGKHSVNCYVISKDRYGQTPMSLDLDLTKLRRIFKRYVTYHDEGPVEGVIEASDLKDAFGDLGVYRCQCETQGNHTYAQFVFCYSKQIGIDIDRIEEVFLSFPAEEGEKRHCRILPVSFSRLKFHYKEKVLYQWCEEQEQAGSPFLDLAEFYLACQSFGAMERNDENNDNDTEDSRSTKSHSSISEDDTRINVAKSGHVRLRRRYCFRSKDYDSDDDDVNSSIGFPTKLMQYQAGIGRSIDSDNEAASEVFGHELTLRIIRRVKAKFVRFLGFKDDRKHISGEEAEQALVELGVATPQSQIREYMVDHDFLGSDSIDYCSFLYAFAKFRYVQAAGGPKPYLQSELRRSKYEMEMEEMMELLSGRLGRHPNSIDYDEYLRSKYNRSKRKKKMAGTYRRTGDSIMSTDIGSEDESAISSVGHNFRKGDRVKLRSTRVSGTVVGRISSDRVKVRLDSDEKGKSISILVRKLHSESDF